MDWIKKITWFSFIILAVLQANAQTTIITHGYAALTSDPINSWMLDMANGICARAGSGVVRVYNKTTGNFDYKSGSGQRTVLLFDWWDDSNDLHKGFSEAAGAALFAALMNGYVNNQFNLSTLHFIGHSRGCIVNSEAIERLIVSGFDVEQATYIDAHDWGGAGISITDYDANPDSINSGVEGWAAINWADSYWQDALFSTNGRAVEGTYQEYKGTISHDGIHDWYLETILDTSLHEGYYYSLVGGGSSQRPSRTGIQRYPFFNFTSDGIVNGDFFRGGVVYETIAGWSYHGGGGDADIDDTYLALHSGGSNKKHDRFYIPANADFIKFAYKINAADEDNAIPYIDKMQVLINDSVVLNNLWMDSTMENWAEIFIDVTQLQNKMATLEFKLIDEEGSTGNLNSEVFIDSIQFDLHPTMLVTNPIHRKTFTIYPNPANHSFQLLQKPEPTEKIQVNIYNTCGRMQQTQILQSNQNKVNTDHLSKGMYIVEIISQGHAERTKLTIQK